MKRFVPHVIGLGLLGSVILHAFSHPCPTHKLEHLRKGMTKDEVRKILGPPTKTYGNDRQWTYERPFVFGFVNIHWQEDGTFDGDVNYERF